MSVNLSGIQDYDVIREAYWPTILCPGRVIHWLGEDNEPPTNYIYFATLVKHEEVYLEEKDKNALALPLTFMLILADHWHCMINSTGTLTI